MRDLHAYQGHPVTPVALALSSPLLLRPGELRQMEWAWVEPGWCIADAASKRDEAPQGGEGGRSAKAGAALDVPPTLAGHRPRFGNATTGATGKWSVPSTDDSTCPVTGIDGCACPEFCW